MWASDRQYGQNRFCAAKCPDGPTIREFILIATKMMKSLCTAYLILFALLEIYSASAAALDDSNRFPAWEAKLGWGLFVLPCLLVFGLFLLLSGKRERLGFSLVGLSLLLYVGFVFLEDLLAPERMGRLDWVFTGMWVTLCAIAMGAAQLLMPRQSS